MKQKGRNVAASVQARLLQLSRNSKLSLQDLLERYCTERLLYRLSRSPHHSRFILKGAMLLIVWGEGSSERVTRDADLLGFGDNSPTAAAAAFRDICAVAVDDDGVQFQVETIEADSIRAEQEYVGVRVTLRARVGNARMPVQADIGFGDAFTLEPEEIEFPTLLDMPKPVLRAYTKETALAEKLEAMVSLGERNSRMKDYFDVWLLSRKFDFQGERLAEAIAATFARRNTEVPATVPVGLRTGFSTEPIKQTQWKAFWRKVVRTEPTPGFEEVVKLARRRARRFVIREGENGKVKVRFWAKRVWIWPPASEIPMPVWLLVSERADKGLKCSLSNADEKSDWARLALRQGQRHFIERAFEDGKSELESLNPRIHCE